jgi:hypothetical protein
VKPGKRTTLEQQMARQHEAAWYQSEMRREQQLWQQLQAAPGASSSSWEEGAAQDPQLPDWLKMQAASVKKQQEQLHWIY